ncbi:MAG: TfoX/Sxy family protein [Clostridia bacterium]|nr:TfoX/Sxy family protein [Clostridia bacterium]
MATSKEALAAVLERLRLVPELTFRPMMGETLLYAGGRLFGGVYDGRLLVKPTASALRMLPEAPHVSPYPGAKEMLLVNNDADPVTLAELVAAMLPELSPPKRRK